MIIIELRGSELRAVHLLNKKYKEVQAVSTLELPRDTIRKLIGGDYNELKISILELSEELTPNFRSQNYSFVINLGETTTHKINVPRVKTKELHQTVSSALIAQKIAMGDEDMIAYAVLKDKDASGYGVIAQLLNKYIPENVIKAFNEMGLKLKYIDVAPNTLIKAFNRSESFIDERPLDLIVDLGESEVRYYQFKDKRFNMNYLDNVSFENLEEYQELFQSNVFQFIDEYTDYSLSDINVILTGDDEIVRHIYKNCTLDVNMVSLGETSNIIENDSMAPLSPYISAIGATIRNDKLVSAQAKYDINLLDKKKVHVKRTGENDVRNAMLASGVIFAIALVYMGNIYVYNRGMKKDNEKMSQIINSPEAVESRKYHAELTNKNNASNSIIDTINNAEKYLTGSQRKINSRYIREIHRLTTIRSEITDIAYKDGTITVNYIAPSEAAFLNYTGRLKESGLFESVDYKAYSHSQSEEGHRYSGQIVLELKAQEGVIYEENVE